MNSERVDEIDSIVLSVLDGNEQALHELLRIVRPLVVRYCRARMGNRDSGELAADDVAQEVCLAVVKALPQYTDQGKPFLAFVYGIAAHKVVDAHRSFRLREQPVSDLPDVYDPRPTAEQDIDHTVSSELLSMLDLLPAKQREILVLRTVVGLSAEETAESVGSTPGAVRVAQHRAVSKLRSAMAMAASGLVTSAPARRLDIASEELAVNLVADALNDHLDVELGDDVDGFEPKEARAFQSLISDIESAVSLTEAVEQVITGYRHRQLQKSTSQALRSDGHLDVGAREAVEWRKHRK